MIKEIKKLKNLVELQEKHNEGQLRTEGYTQESLNASIEKQQKIVLEQSNILGWLLLLLVFPFFLTHFEISLETAIFIEMIIVAFYLYFIHGYFRKLL